MIKSFLKKYFLKEKISSDKVEIGRKSETFKKPKMFNENDVKKMILLKKEGYSNVKVAQIMKCSEKTVRNYLKNYNAPVDRGQI